MRPTAGRKNTRSSRRPRDSAALRRRPASSARARRAHRGARRNTPAATLAQTALPSRASRASTAPIHEKRRYGSPRSARSRRSKSPRTRAAPGANRRFSLLAAVAARPRCARLRCRPTASARRHRPPLAYNLPTGGRGPFFVAPRAPPGVPGSVFEWVSFGKPSSPGVRNRAAPAEPNEKPSSGGCSVLLGR